MGVPLVYRVLLDRREHKVPQAFKGTREEEGTLVIKVPRAPQVQMASLAPQDLLGLRG